MAESVSLTVIIDNKAGPGLEAEHGLSVWIETPWARILFDTGQSDLLERNARALGVDLSLADAVVLSHGHYDHTGGLAHALRAAPGGALHCHPGVVLPRYAKDGPGLKPVQMPEESRRAVKELDPARMVWTGAPVRLAGEVWLSGPVPRRCGGPGEGWPFFLDPQGARPDPIEDDMCLWIDTPGGLLLVLGCCHSGVRDTLDHVREASGGKRIACVTGGLHLMDSGEEEIAAVARELLSRGVERVAPLHCTGERAASVLRDCFGQGFIEGRSGLRLSF